uniref:Uncharacterized protein n=1 Tax=Leclercia adecarboxylata TaxID=83655 RepID=A0A482M1F5_9ENTR|nr:Hypothetical protein [Leclercia adecarboxylata]
MSLMSGSGQKGTRRLRRGEALILSERVAVRPQHAKALLISTKWQKTKIHSGME